MPYRRLPEGVKPIGRTVLVQQVKQSRQSKGKSVFLPGTAEYRTAPFVAKVLRAGGDCEVVSEGDFVLVTGWAARTASGSVDFADGTGRMFIDERYEILATIAYDQPSDLLSLVE